jgi:Fe-S cluster assembly iron-binding protein IscA
MLLSQINALTPEAEYKPGERRDSMLTVTAKAKEKLRELLEKRATELEVVMRIIHSPSNPEQLEFVMDKEKEGDQVVESEDGRKVLLIGPDLASSLVGMVIDYQETAEATGFSMSKPGPSA